MIPSALCCIRDNIFRDDEVIITRQIIDNRQFTDIELVGDMDE